MSEKTKSASDLLYAFVKAETDIETAEKMMKDARSAKELLLDEILAHDQLRDALQEPGVICNSKVCTLIDDDLCIYPEPVNIFSIKEVKVLEKANG